MTKYDNIYVPNEMLGPYEACDIRSGSLEKGRLYKKENVIVLTIEELRELWHTAQLYGEDCERNKSLDLIKVTHFNNYLTSKGITL